MADITGFGQDFNPNDVYRNENVSNVKQASDITESAPKQTEEELDQIIVDDGRVRVPIKNTFGDEIGVFYFNPTDIGILKRFENVREKFADVVSPLMDANIGADGNGIAPSDVEKLEEAEKRLYELCDYLFGGNLSKAFFGTINPFSPINGVFYCENALNMVAEYVSRKFDSEVKKINSRIEKYTHGLRTGKHRNGRQ